MLDTAQCDDSVAADFIRVLIVDDNDVDREKLRRLLRGYRVEIRLEEAASLDEAHTRLSHHRFDCVIVDYNLGGSGHEGLDLTPIIRKYSGRECPIIMVTGFGSESIAVDAMRQGVFDYLNKNVLDRGQLTHALEKGFEWSQMQQKLDAAERELKHRSLYDTLTGLPNRDLFHDRLDQALASAQRFGVVFSLFLMDLDRFKEVNDSLGHQVGDQVLKEAAQRLVSALRSVDTVARLGGDEFVAIMPGVETIEHAECLARKIIDRFRKPIIAEGQSLLVGISIGIAHCPKTSSSRTELIAAADKAMYHAKKRLGHVVAFGTNLHDHDVPPLHHALIGDIERGIKAQEFVMFFQPKVNLRTLQCSGIEALVRWERLNEGLIPPGVFIPEIEGSHLLEQFTLHLFRLLARQYAALCVGGAPISVSFNLSSRMLEDHTLCEKLCEILDKYAVPAQQITLEVTETALIVNPHDAKLVVMKLRAAGFGISIDDFGSGFTSFSYLREFPVTEIKLDKLFVENLGQMPFDAALVRSLSVLCRTLGIKFVAEGVETADIMDALREAECGEVQGYYIARPMPASAVVDWLATWQEQHPAPR